MLLHIRMHCLALQQIPKGTVKAISNLASALIIPDSLLAKEATGILREYSTDLLINHSIRVYLFAAEQGRERKLRFDPELLYIAAVFHDFGLIKSAVKKGWRPRAATVWW
jgi:HD superfamily phosphodiesterase